MSQLLEDPENLQVNSNKSISDSEVQLILIEILSQIYGRFLLCRFLFQLVSCEEQSNGFLEHQQLTVVFSSPRMVEYSI